MVNILLIGCGYHARRIYVPCLSGRKDVTLAAIVDLSSQRETIENYLRQQNIHGVRMQYTDRSEISDVLTEEETRSLDKLVARENIQAVVISTEPLAHLKYANWALRNRLHILMDKPVTTEIDASTSVVKARKLYLDYLALKKTYLSTPARSRRAFMLQAQRRYHAGFLCARDMIVEISKKTNCPVTAIRSFHSDGQWRFPEEIVHQHYHPYNQGYGKMSHSGYHSLDIGVWLAESSILDPKKRYDNFELFAQAVRPVDFLSQFTPNDYLRLFPNMKKSGLVSSGALKKMIRNGAARSVTGELDMHTLISLRHGDDTMTNISCDAVHNGFSQRNWVSAAGRDLYKGNGRVRHESYVIEQGPFQCIIINSFQSQEILKGDIVPNDVGGEYHFDIHIFRNSTLFPEYAAHKLVRVSDLKESVDLQYSRGHQEDARRMCVEEFLSAVRGKVVPERQASNFLNHELSTQLLSAIYESVSSDADSRIVRNRIRSRHRAQWLSAWPPILKRVSSLLSKN